MNCGWIKIDRGQPVRILRERRASHRELNIFKLAVRAGRRGLEPSKAVEATTFLIGGRLTRVVEAALASRGVGGSNPSERANP